MLPPENRDVPYIVPPDNLDEPPGLVCFVNANRTCGADCMAYTVNTPGAEYNDSWGHCLCLASLFRISKHAVILAQQAEVQAHAAKTAMDDIARSSCGPAVQPFVPPTPKVLP